MLVCLCVGWGGYHGDQELAAYFAWYTGTSPRLDQAPVYLFDHPSTSILTTVSTHGPAQAPVCHLGSYQLMGELNMDEKLPGTQPHHLVLNGAKCYWQYPWNPLFQGLSKQQDGSSHILSTRHGSHAPTFILSVLKVICWAMYVYLCLTGTSEV